jgi:hypothetical protein
MPINWQDVLTSIGTTLVSGTVAIGAAAWVIKTLLSDRLARQFEAFKIQVKADSDAANERLKNALQMMTLDHQVRFSRLHEKRAEAIEALDKQAYELEQKAGQYAFNVGGVGTEQGPEMYRHVVDKLLDFNAYRESHRIYLSDEVNALLYRFFTTVKEPIVVIGSYSGFGNASQETLRQHSESILKAVQAISQHVPDVRSALIKEFRAILDWPLDAPSGTD